MSNYRPLYEDTDTDGTALRYCQNNVLVTKQVLNSLYGTKGVNYMNREYISVIVEEHPTVIFNRNIIAVSKNGSNTMITCVGDVIFFTKEDYASVVKKIIG